MEIDGIFPDNKGTKDFDHEEHTMVPGSATTGAGYGCCDLMGHLVVSRNWCARDSRPRHVYRRRPIMAALAGAPVAGAVGGLVGALVGMAIPRIRSEAI